jgi:hypothetical protein
MKSGSLKLMSYVLVATLPLGSLSAAEQQAEVELDAIVVTGKRVDIAEPTQLTQKLNQVPGTLGDALQSLFTLPGIVPSMEFGGQPAVRGSGPEDNTYLIDFLPAAYLFHEFGDSIVSEDLLRDFGVETAGFGARYGNATGGLFDIRLREPRQQPLRSTLELSFLRAGATVEGGLGDNQSFFFSYRESLMGLAMRTQADTMEEEEDLRFNTYPEARDLTAKYSWKISPEDHLSLLFIGAQDITALDVGERSDFGLTDPEAAGEASVDTTFGSAGLRYTHTGDDLNAEAGIGGTWLRRRDELGDANEYAHTRSKHWTANARVDARAGDRQRIVVGADAARREIDYQLQLRYRPCSIFTPDCFTEHGEMIYRRDLLKLDTAAMFAEHIWSPTEALELTTGVRESYDRYLDEWHTEPRISGRLNVTRNLSLHSSAGRYHQAPDPEQMVSGLGNPEVDSPEAWHYVLGVKQKLGDGWSWSADGYYKDLRKVIIDTSTPKNYDNLATGETWGAELMLNKEQTGRWYGWVSASLSRSRRTNTVTGETVPFSFDTPLVATMVGNYQISSRWSAGLRWTYRSGMPYTSITGNHENPDYPGYYLPDYGAVNEARADDYHRLDLRVARTFGGRGRFQGSFFFDLVNAYGRNSGGAAQYKPEADGSGYELEQSESLPMLMSVGVKVSF